MRIPFKQLKKMPVETVSGIKLGKIQEIIMDIENQMVVQYEIKAIGISSEKYLINRDQIARFEAKKVIVYDTVIKKREKKTSPPLPAIPEPGVAMQNEKVFI